MVLALTAKEKKVVRGIDKEKRVLVLDALVCPEYKLLVD